MRRASLFIPCLFCFVLLGCAGSELEPRGKESQTENTDLEEVGSESSSQESELPGDPDVMYQADQQEIADQVGLPCTSDADCGVPALGCGSFMRPVCAVICDDENPCPGAPCRGGFCPLCGDGFCAGPEQQNADLCPVDCAVDPEGPRERRETFTLTNPRSGVELHGEIFFPADASAENQYPGVVLVPGGIGSGQGFILSGATAALASRGIISVIFDLDGRGKSGGVEDQCGADHQAGVNAMIEHLAQVPEVAAGRLGVASKSFGITCASGALSTFRETTSARFLVDFEGPANRDDTAGCDGSGLGHLDPLEHPCDDEDWWQFREASENIKRVRVPYLRLQKIKDHAQPDNAHAVLMINSATNTTHGGDGESPWTLINDGSMNTPNAVYDAGEIPQWLESCEVDCRVGAIERMLARLP